MPSFAQGAQIDVHLKTLKEHLDKNSRNLLDAFHHFDKDNSQQLTSDEFAACLRECNVVVPQHIMQALIA